jgi:hypothetical protein
VRISRCMLLLLITAVSMLAQANVNTIPGWNGTDYISSFGVVNTATYGQTITITSTATLNSFAFEIGNCGASVTMRASIYAWSGTNATGTALYQSAPVTIPNSASFQLVPFTPGVELAPGAYVLFVSTSEDQTGAPASACRFGAVADTAYTGGQFVFINNGPDPAQWTSGTWSFINEDLAFTMIFEGAPVPLPSGVWVTLIGLVALGLLSWFWRVSRSGPRAATP